MLPANKWIYLLLIILGTLSVFSLRGISLTLATNQFLFFLLGGLVYTVAANINFELWKRGRWWWYGATIILLILTLLIGTTTKGSLSWIKFGSYRLQPSELLKPTLILLLATQFGQINFAKLANLLKFSALAGLPLLLVMLQPDLGTSITIVVALTVIYFKNHPPFKQIAALSLVSFVVITVSWFTWLAPYQKDRLRSFVIPSHDLQGSSYNVRQAMIAVGSGGWWGLGWGEGRQSHLRFLPEQQTDFLFATYAEERGFFGSMFLVSLYTALFYYLISVARKLPDPAAQTFALASSILLLGQTFINIGMNIGISPVTGIPLPLFSLGGSSLISTSLILGWIESARRSHLASPSTWS